MGSRSSEVREIKSRLQKSHCRSEGAGEEEEEEEEVSGCGDGDKVRTTRR